MSKWMIAAGFAVAFGFAGQALANEDSTGQVRRLDLAQVDFRDQAAVKAFYAKVQEAAEAVCAIDSRVPEIRNMDRACVERAIAQTVRKVDRPVLTAMYQADDRADKTAYARENF